MKCKEDQFTQIYYGGKGGKSRMVYNSIISSFVFLCVCVCMCDMQLKLFFFVHKGRIPTRTENIYTYTYTHINTHTYLIQGKFVKCLRNIQIFI